VLDQLERLKEEPVTGDELEGIKTRMKADWVRSVESNTGMANLLASSEVVLGSWKEGLRWLQKIDAVTAADLQRVAKETFTVNNRTVGLIITEEEGSDDAS
jgi:predicted Zn-dependent peptidase